MFEDGASAARTLAAEGSVCRARKVSPVHGKAVSRPASDHVSSARMIEGQSG